VPPLAQRHTFTHSVRTRHINNRDEQNRSICKRLDKAVKPLLNSVSQTCIRLNLGVMLTRISGLCRVPSRSIQSRRRGSGACTGVVGGWCQCCFSVVDAL